MFHVKRPRKRWPREWGGGVWACGRMGVFYVSRLRSSPIFHIEPSNSHTPKLPYQKNSHTHNRFRMPNSSASLTEEQNRQLRAYASELVRINQQINLISAATEDEIWKRHIRHCLTLTQREFPAGSVVVDWGSGGGLPALPLAIACPHITVHAVDSVRKKMQAVQMMARRLGIENVHTHHTRAERWTGGPVHYSVSRATAPLAGLWAWHSRLAEPLPPEPGGAWAPGLLTLKGGDLQGEITDLKAAAPGVLVASQPLQPGLSDPYFQDKVLIHVTAAA